MSEEDKAKQIKLRKLKETDKQTSIQKFRESLRTSKIQNAIANRPYERMEEFRKHGLTAPIKTYKTNPMEKKKN